jgi:hypothetical protein
MAITLDELDVAPKDNPRVILLDLAMP